METVDTSVADGIVTVRLNRPRVHNALDRATLGRWLEAVESAVADRDTRVLVLAGGDAAFTTGDDLRETAELDSAGFAAHIENFQRLTATLRRADVPTIASIAGFAYGGGLEIAVSCDARIAADNARFACPEPAWGLTLSNASSVLLRRLVGDGWARELFLFGRTLDAAEAERSGLVTRVVPLADLDRRTAELAQGAASMSPHALKLTKRLLNRGDEEWLVATMAAETAAVAEGFDSDDARSRLRAFADRKRST